MDQSTEAASPASAQTQSGDGKEQSGNLSLNAAAASLLKKLGTTEESSTPAAAEATPEDAPDATPTETPAADAAETASDSSEPEADAEVAADEAAPEAAESTATEEQAEGDVLSPKSSLDQKTKDKVQQRINEAMAAKKAAEAQVELLKQQLAQLSEAPKTAETPVLANPGPNAPLPEVKDAQQLKALQQQAKEVVRWAEEQLDRDDLGDGIVVDGKTWTKAELKQVVRTAKITLEDKIPAQQEYLAAQARFAQERAKSSTYARGEFPFLADKTSPDYQKAQTLLRDPWVQQNPHAEYFVGVFLEGQKALEAKKAAAAKPAEAAKPKPKIPAGKPPGDQAAVGANGSTAVRAPAAGANRVVAAEKAKWKSSGGLSASQAAASLQRMTSAKRAL